jgi:hypothetical protein
MPMGLQGRSIGDEETLAVTTTTEEGYTVPNQLL